MPAFQTDAQCVSSCLLTRPLGRHAMDRLSSPRIEFRATRRRPGQPDTLGTSRQEEEPQSPASRPLWARSMSRERKANSPGPIRRASILTSSVRVTLSPGISTGDPRKGWETGLARVGAARLLLPRLAAGQTFPSISRSYATALHERRLPDLRHSTIAAVGRRLPRAFGVARESR